MERECHLRKVSKVKLNKVKDLPDEVRYSGYSTFIGWKLHYSMYYFEEIIYATGATDT